jgi:hypothetical protein
MLVFSYAVELDAADSKADTYDDLLREAARAYRLRAACANSRGDAIAAERDLKRASTLEAKLKTPDGRDLASGSSGSRVTIINDWAEPVTVVIGGVNYTLPAGESKSLASPPGSFPYELLAGTHRVKGTIEAGRSYRVKPPSQ